MIRNYRQRTCFTAIGMFVLGMGTLLAEQAKVVAPKQVQQLLTKRFPQVNIGECNDSDTNPLVFGNIIIQSRNGNISLHGSDNQGNPWVAQMEISPVSECQVWASDLGKNQRQDLLILSMGTNSSGGWDSQLSLLLFDENGRPFPWQAIGNFGADSNGILQVVRHGTNGAAEIIVPKLGGDRYTGLSYAYNLLGVTGNLIHRITVAEDSSKWPLLVSPTKDIIDDERTYEPSTLSGGAGPAKDASIPRSFIAELDNADSMQDEQLILSTKEVVGYPKLIMIDKSNGERFIDFDPSQDEIKQLKSVNASVQAIGTTCDRGNCQPLLLWAKE